jgi:hypothetical protein
MGIVAFRREAETEIAEAVDWYEARGRGLGAAFLRALDAALAAVQRNPAAHPVVFGRARRALLRRFPYSLVYVMSDAMTTFLSLHVCMAGEIRVAGKTVFRAKPAA